MSEDFEQEKENQPEETKQEYPAVTNPEIIPPTNISPRKIRIPKKRGVGITRKSKSPTKKAVKLAKKQRAINQHRKNKKFHKHGSKQRK